MLRIFALLGVLLSVSLGAQAQQNGLPELPAPIQNLVDEGAQIRFLGRDFGFDAWLTIKNGQEQYFYVKPEGDAFLMGVLFDKKGEMITVDQVQRLRETNGDLLDVLAGETGPIGDGSNIPTETRELKTPSERLFFDIENSNWVALGAADAPVIYSFIDPQCPHCHSFIKDLRKDYLDTGRIQVRMIPVGFRDQTRAQSAFLLATPDAQNKFYAHMDGDEGALPVRSELNQQGVQRNLAIMQSWKLNVTPMIVYRGRDGSVKIVRGKPKDIPGMMRDLQG